MFNFFKKKKSEVENINSSNYSIVKQQEWQGDKPTIEQLLLQYKGWVFICAKLNAESVAQTPLKLYAKTSPKQKPIKNFDLRKVENKEFKRLTKQISSIRQTDTIEEVYDHPASILLNEVNDFSNGFDNFQLTQTYIDLTGNAYFFVEKDKSGLPVKIKQLRPDLVEVVPGKTKLIYGYLYGKSDKIALKVEDVVRFTNPNPNNPWYGMSCVEAGASQIARLNLIEQYTNTVLKNQGRLDILLKYNGKLTKDDHKALTQEWNRLYSSPENAGKVKVMDLDWEVQELGLSPKDIEYLKGKQITQREVCQMFGVPYALLDTSEQLKAGLDQIIPLYQRFAISPRLKRIEETLNEQYLPMWENTEDLFFAYDNVVDENKDFELKKTTELVKAGVMTVEEAREKEGLA